MTEEEAVKIAAKHARVKRGVRTPPLWVRFSPGWEDLRPGLERPRFFVTFRLPIPKDVVQDPSAITIKVDTVSGKATLELDI